MAMSEWDKWQAGQMSMFESLSSSGARGKPYQFDQSNFLVPQLQKMATGDNPYLKDLFSLVSGKIGKKTNQAIESTNQSLANTGLGRAGVGLAAKTGIYEGQAEAISGLSSQIGQLDMDWRTKAIGSLLGIDQMQSQSQLANKELDQNAYMKTVQNILGMRGLNIEQQKANDASSAGLWEFLGSVLNAGGQIGAAAASDIRLKKNIIKLGEINGIGLYRWEWNDIARSLGISTIPIGAIAQEVLRIKPEAVIDGNYLMIDYNRL